MSTRTGTGPAAHERAHLLDLLEAEVLALRSSERWSRYLRAQARFHRYSPRNVMLIALQRPDASSVAGYRTWAALDRQVRRGEHGISILAPLLCRTEPDAEPTVAGFRWVTVFDVSQTDGAPLPTPVVLLEGAEPDQLTWRLARVAERLGFAVELDALAIGVNGETRWATSTIALEPANGPLQRAKTLAHELGHVLLHRHELDRSRAEIEAEAVAFVVLAACGADSSPYSAGYLSSWIGEERDPLEAVRSSCDAIHRASTQILELLEDETLHRRGGDDELSGPCCAGPR